MSIALARIEEMIRAGDSHTAANALRRFADEHVLDGEIADRIRTRAFLIETPPPDLSPAAREEEIRHCLRELEDTLAPLRRQNGAEAAPAAAGELTPAGALAESRVDLIGVIREGIPEREYVPGASRILIAGKRHLWVAPAGGGKSLAALVLAVDVVEAGGAVAILDVENGEDEYARRLADVIDARDDGAGTLAAACSERLRYYAWPRLRLTWPADDWAAAFDGVALAIFDSSRLALSSVGLAEDSSDDYATFSNAILIPLVRARTATLTLDNTGWEERDRARGSSAKHDLNEAVYAVKPGAEFNPDREGHLRLVRKRTRFPELAGELRVPLGGEVYGPVEEVEPSSGSDGFRPTRIMERVSGTVADTPGLSQNAIETAVGGRAEFVRLAIELLVVEGYVRIEREGRARHHYSQRPFSGEEVRN